jgi:hypothetical protein
MTAVWVTKIGAAKPQRFVSFTSIGDTRIDIRLGLQHLMRDLRKGVSASVNLTPDFGRDGAPVHRQLSKKFNATKSGRAYRFEYFGTVELHKSGMAHMHLLQKGDFIPNGYLEKIAAKNGWGFSDIRAIGGEAWRHRYVMKHLAHSHGRRWEGRLIRYSRGFFDKARVEVQPGEPGERRRWEFVMGRADRVADDARADGWSVAVGDMGVDWEMGEEAPDPVTGQLYDDDIMLEWCKRYERYVKYEKERRAAKLDASREKGND